MSKSVRRWGALLAAAGLLAACGGGGGDGDEGYERVVSFGDSLSDAGTYQVTEVRAMGGGRFTVNADDVLLWTDLVAREVGAPRPCPAVQGLESTFAVSGLTPSPRVERDECFNYAQGGARVSNPIGPNNKALAPEDGGALGHLTEPLTQQVALHLEKGNGRFDQDELVTVLAGGNDLFVNLAAVETAAAQPGATQQSIDAAVQAAVAAMATAGTQLATLVKEQMVAKGAERVVVVNLPDVSLTPDGLAAEPLLPGLIRTMSSTFNANLAQGLQGVDEVLLVDAFARSQAQAASPGDFNLTNVTNPVCNSTLRSWNCTEATLTVADISGHLYADGVHPTPRGHFLLADLVLTAIANRGWL